MKRHNHHSNPKRTHIEYHTYTSNTNHIQVVWCHHPTIAFVEQGTAHIHAKRSLIIDTGGIYILYSGHHYLSYHSNENDDYKEICVTIPDDMVHKLIYNLPLPNKPHTIRTQIPTSDHIDTTPLLRNYFEGLKEYLHHKLFVKSSTMECIKINELLFIILTDTHSRIAKDLQWMLRNERLNFEEHIEANIFRNATIETLAAECGISPSSFKATFHKHFGTSPHRWFLSRRLHTAAILLQCTSKQIKTIALECGFVSISHMIRLFRETYGTTPAQYRAAYQTADTESPNPHTADSELRNENSEHSPRCPELHSENSEHRPQCPEPLTENAE